MARNNYGAPVVIVNGPDQPVYTSGGGGGGGGTSDATAANQTTEIARLTTIRDVMTTAFGALPATADRSGTATTTSGALTVAANTARRLLVGQNISTVVIGFNEQGGTAAIGTAGTYTVQPGASFSVSSNKAVNFVAASGSAAVTMTES